MRKKRLTVAEFQEIKNEVKTIIQEIKENIVVTEQPERESEDEETCLGSEGEPAMLKECKVLIEHLICDAQERNDIRNEDQNNVNKDDEFIAQNFKEISKMREDKFNELSNVKYTEIKGRESQKYKINKKNKRMRNLGNNTFESIVRDMTVGINEYREQLK